MNPKRFYPNNLDEISGELRKEIDAAQSKADKVGLSQLYKKYTQVLMAVQDYEQGEIQFHDAISLAKDLEDPRLEAQYIGALGNMYVATKKMDEGYKCFEQVLDIAIKIDDYQLESDALGSMGLVHLDTGDPAMAIEKFNTALKIAETKQDRRRKMNHLSGLGNTYLNIAAEDQAIQFFNQSYDLALELEDEQAQAGFLNNIAIIKKNARDKDGALKLFEQVRSLTRRINDLHGERNALRHLINLYSESNKNNDLVLVYIRRAIDLSQQLNDYASEVGYYDALILVLLTLNRHTEALELIDKALHDKRLPEFSERQMQLLVNRGNACFDGNQIEQAFDAYNQALDASVRRQNENVEARMLGRLGAVQAELGNFESAIAYAGKSLEKARDIEDTRLIGQQYCMLALANRDLGNRVEAIEYCEQALKIVDTDTADPLKEKILDLLDDLRQKPEL